MWNTFACAYWPLVSLSLWHVYLDFLCLLKCVFHYWIVEFIKNIICLQVFYQMFILWILSPTLWLFFFHFLISLQENRYFKFRVQFTIFFCLWLMHFASYPMVLKIFSCVFLWKVLAVLFRSNICSNLCVELWLKVLGLCFPYWDPVILVFHL